MVIIGHLSGWQTAVGPPRCPMIMLVRPESCDQLPRARVVLGPVAVLCVLVARHGGQPRTRATDRLLAALFVLAAVATVLAWARAASMGFDAQYAHHLKLTWIALDVAEAAALLMTAGALRWHPVRIPAAAAVTAALLCSDVWFNVVGAVGEARTNAIQMAVVSIPLAVALVLGVRAVRLAD